MKCYEGHGSKENKSRRPKKKILSPLLGSNSVPIIPEFQNSKRTHTVASLREGTMLQEIQALGDLRS